MAEHDRERWQAKYREKALRSPGPPSDWLVTHLRKLPRGGTALDLACGDGANALLLASRGFRVTAVDIAPLALELGKRVAGPLPIEWIEADLDEWQPPESAFDVVLCFRFLDRERLPGQVLRALKPGGWFLAETFTVSPNSGSAAQVTNPDYLLQPGEWPRLFPTLEVVDERRGGDLEAIVARRPLGSSESGLELTTRPS